MARTCKPVPSTRSLLLLGVLAAAAIVASPPAVPGFATSSRTVGVLVHDATRTSPGYTLLAPKHYTRTYLIDNNGHVVRTWDSDYVPGQSAYLLPNGHLLRTCMVQIQGGGTGGGEGGRIEEYDWDGNLVWEFDYATRDHQLHHDIAALPNGNVLALMVERKTRAQALDAGFNPTLLPNADLLPDAVVEIEPIRPRGGRIVWEWHTWDHLVQRFDSVRMNYGDPSAHPELVNPNASSREIPAFWNHMNAIDYNADLDQIALSVRGNSEVWIIERSGTTAVAAAHSGGRYGKGGDLLYRWGNPQMYGAGSAGDQMLFQQHDVQWIAADRPGAGHLLAFNNGIARPGGSRSTVDEIVPPVDEHGTYAGAGGTAFAPRTLAWTYDGSLGTEYYAEAISGAERLPNGNTLICFGTRGVLAEVTTAGEVVWQYVNPVVKEGPLRQGEISGVDQRGHNWNAVFKVRRYDPGYPGLIDKELTPAGPIETMDDESGDPSPAPTPPADEDPPDDLAPEPGIPDPDSPTALATSTYPVTRLIDAGSFEMGDHHGLGGIDHGNDELPVHTVWVDAFHMGRTEVTNRQYVEFLNAALAQGTIEVRDGLVYGRGTSTIYVETLGAASYFSLGFDGAAFTVVDHRASHPVVGNRWFGAAAYANWLSALQGYQTCYDVRTWACDPSGNGYRLPTEAEWEYAGRGGQYDPYRVYPWGDDATATRANWPNSGDPYETGAYPWTTPAAFYTGALQQKAAFAWPGAALTYQTSNGANAYGLYDMAGNVWEWCHDWYNRDYYSVSPAINPPGPSVGSPMPDGLPYRVLRGGNWYNGPEGHSRVSNRNPSYNRGPDDPNHPWYHVGFRVARRAAGGAS